MLRAELGGRDVLDAAQGVVAVSRDAALMKHNDGQKLADVAHKPSRSARRHQRRKHVPESQLAPEAQPMLDRFLHRTMPIGHQIRRDQRARARLNDHPHLVL